MTVNEDLHQAYIMLLDSKNHLRNAGCSWLLKESVIEDICNEISGIQDKIYELVHYYDEDEDKEYKWKKMQEKL